MAGKRTKGSSSHITNYQELSYGTLLILAAGLNT